MSTTRPPLPPGAPIVVCVDDDEAVLTAVMRCLRKEAFDVRRTTSPHEALSWITTEPVAVLVADYEMPELNGAQLAGQARRVRPETVRILLTGNQTLETAVRHQPRRDLPLHLEAVRDRRSPPSRARRDLAP